MDSGWRLVRGAGGFSYWHDAHKWITSVYATRELAAIAADKLEAGALDVLRRERAKALPAKPEL
jgi:hypothetical protein